MIQLYTYGVLPAYIAYMYLVYGAFLDETSRISKISTRECLKFYEVGLSIGTSRYIKIALLRCDHTRVLSRAEYPGTRVPEYPSTRMCGWPMGILVLANRVFFFVFLLVIREKLKT